MWHTQNDEDRNKGIDNDMCSSSSMKVTFEEHFAKAFYSLLFYPLLKFQMLAIKKKQRQN